MTVLSFAFAIILVGVGVPGILWAAVVTLRAERRRPRYGQVIMPGIELVPHMDMPPGWRPSPCIPPARAEASLPAMTDEAITLDEPQPCFRCGEPTTRVDLDYQAPFCNSEACNASIASDLAEIATRTQGTEEAALRRANAALVRIVDDLRAEREPTGAAEPAVGEGSTAGPRHPPAVRCWDCDWPLVVRRWFLGHRAVWWCACCAEVKRGLRPVPTASDERGTGHPVALPADLAEVCRTPSATTQRAPASPSDRPADPKE